MRITVLQFIAAAMLMPGLAAAQTLATGGPHRPAAVPADYVITPFGYFHPSCVVHLAPGDEVRSDQHLIRHANGTADGMHVCAYPRFRADGEKVLGDERHIKKPDISHAWIEYASITTTGSYGYLYAEWSVPPTPASKDGQTLFLFPGLEDSNDVVTILQPVLGWNSDYASSWGIASWNCCESGTTYEGTPQHASPGDTILGYMFDTCATGVKSCATWDVVTWDLQTGKFSDLVNTSSFGQTFNWAFGGALEVYNVVQCTDFPSNGSYAGSHAMSFNEIGLYNYYGEQTAPTWSIATASGLTPSCSYGGSQPKQVILTY